MKNYSVRKPMPDRVKEALSAYDSVLQELLYGRGIENRESAEYFLRPDYDKHIHDPYLLRDMDGAVDIILAALSNNEKIAIFSDYDADGIPGAVILSDFFKKIDYKNFLVYIPHRNDEGYGMNMEALEKLAKENISLLITIDCGISNHKEVERAKELGMKVIVTDHHLPKDTLPGADAVINPKRLDCTYPDKNLCGSGVIWKLVSALCAALRKTENVHAPSVGWEKWLLDMAGLATLSDMVPLVGENRVIASYGLVVMRKSPRPGLHKLFSILKMRQHDITEDDIGFLITPRINAASRMGHPKDAFDMLSSHDPVEAGTLAEHLNTINDERKGVVGSMVREIKNNMHKREGLMRNVIVMGSPEWKPSLLGLVANSFSDEHARPVFLWGREGGSGGMLKGSCRSGGSASIVAIMQESADIFEEYGGHHGAGGFSISPENVHVLEERLNQAFEKVVKEASEDESVYIDKELTVADVNWKLYSHIEKLAPFGMENPKPLFMIANAEVVSSKQFGKEKNHLEIVLKNPTGRPIQAISFFTAPEKYGPLEPGKKINMVAHVEKSTFRNFPELRLRIVDVV